MLLRELASVITNGELRDPRLSPAAMISVTGVKVSADLSSARVYVDVLGSQLSIDKVVAALNAGKGAARARLSGRIRLKRVPALSFFHDASIEQGTRIERVLIELADERRAQVDEPSADVEGDGGAPTDAGDDEGDPA